MPVAFHAAAAVAAPPAIVERAERACSRQTWFHPESEGRIVARHGNAVVSLACHRTEGNTLVVDRISVSFRVGDGLDDPAELTALEERTCRPFRSVPCEVSVL